ncbi:acyltransferase family protein, partial [Sphingomonas faeni]|uniref:acyltransferase family protein n=1 Tax=Sphingomonas faeni TaxID=185950 RepID=UPI0020C0936A
SLGLLQDADDLLFRKLLPLHLSVPFRGRTLAPTGGKNGGHVNWRTYATARIARIYPVLIIAIIVTAIADAVGISTNSQAYVNQPWFNADTGIWHAFRILSFTNEIWFQHIIFGSDEPLWSLGFELPFYLIMGLFLFLRGNIRTVLLLLWFALFGPKIAAFLLLWIIGVATFDVTSKLKDYSNTILGILLFGAPLLIYVYIKASVWDWPYISIYMPGSYRVIAISLGYYLGIALLISCNIVGLSLLPSQDSVPRWLSKSIEWLAGGSFTLYAVHEPLLAFARANFPNVVQNYNLGLFSLAVIMLVAYGLAEIGERPKIIYKSFVAKCMSSRKNH